MWTTLHPNVSLNYPHQFPYPVPAHRRPRPVSAPLNPYLQYSSTRTMSLPWSLLPPQLHRRKLAPHSSSANVIRFSGHASNTLSSHPPHTPTTPSGPHTQNCWPPATPKSTVSGPRPSGAGSCHDVDPFGPFLSLNPLPRLQHPSLAI